MILIGLAIYLVLGFFIVKKTLEDVDGEILGALMFLWPALLAGKVIEKCLKRLGIYHEILKIIFTVLMSLAVLCLFAIYAKELFGR